MKTVIITLLFSISLLGQGGSGTSGGQTYIAPGGRVRPVPDKLAESISVLDYCVLALTDYISCMQAAINAVAAENGGELYLPAGNYKATTLIVPTSIVLQGVAAGGSHNGYSLPQFASTITQLAAAGAAPLIHFTNNGALSEGNQLHNLGLIGNGNTGSTGVQVTGFYGFSMTGCGATNFGTGVLLEIQGGWAQNATLENNLINFNFIGGVRLTTTDPITSALGSAGMLRVLNNSIDVNGVYGFFAEEAAVEISLEGNEMSGYYPGFIGAPAAGSFPSGFTLGTTPPVAVALDGAQHVTIRHTNFENNAGAAGPGGATGYSIRTSYNPLTQTETGNTVRQLDTSNNDFAQQYNHELGGACSSQGPWGNQAQIRLAYVLGFKSELNHYENNAAHESWASASASGSCPATSAGTATQVAVEFGPLLGNPKIEFSTLDERDSTFNGASGWYSGTPPTGMVVQGFNAAPVLTSGAVTVLGNQAAPNVTGGDVIAVGNGAGSGVTTDIGGVLVGQGTGTSGGPYLNYAAFGSGITVNQSNSLWLGNPSMTLAYIFGLPNCVVGNSLSYSASTGVFTCIPNPPAYSAFGSPGNAGTIVLYGASSLGMWGTLVTDSSGNLVMRPGLGAGVSNKFILYGSLVPGSDATYSLCAASFRCNALFLNLADGLTRMSGSQLGLATYADVVSLWSSCTSGYLSFNGACGGSSLTATASANQVLAGPTSGSAAAPAFRALVSADVPMLNQSTTGNAATATALAATPSTCTNQFPLGISANGNAYGCTNVNSMNGATVPANAALVATNGSGQIVSTGWTYWATAGYGSGAIGVTANHTECAGIILPLGTGSVGHIAINVAAGDGGGANKSDVGIYSATGTLEAHIGAQILNTTGNVTYAFSGGTQTVAGGKSYVCYTSSSSTFTVIDDIASATFRPYLDVGTTTTGGALVNITAPSDAPAAVINGATVALVLYP